jgi:hypothetical protein
MIIHSIATSLLVTSATATIPADAPPPKVKVFILAGQSNMEGHGQVHSLEILGEHPTYGHHLDALKAEDGSWAVRKDVTIAWASKPQLHGPLTVGWGYGENEIGPELLFGTIMGDHFDQPVLLIKTAWGGKDVYCDFRSPSAGMPNEDEAALLVRQTTDGNARVPGTYYTKMLAEITSCLERLDQHVPGYTGQGYELAGMAWFQGWNDYCQWHVEIDGKDVGSGLIETYPTTLAAMFQDLRSELNAPTLPIVIGEMGIGGTQISERAHNPDDREACAIMAFRRAQQAVSNAPGMNGVVYVPTEEYWDDRLELLRTQADEYRQDKKRRGISDTDDNTLPTPELTREFHARGGHWYCHYNGSASNYSLVGLALAEALLSMDPSSTGSP